MSAVLYVAVCCLLASASAAGLLLGLWVGQGRADRWRRRFDALAAEKAELDGALDVALTALRRQADPHATTVLPVLQPQPASVGYPDDATRILGHFRGGGDW